MTSGWSNLTDDDHGRAALTTLQASGMDTGYVTMWAGETQFTEILLEPNGERTILNTDSQLRPPFVAPEPVYPRRPSSAARSAASRTA